MTMTSDTGLMESFYLYKYGVHPTFSKIDEFCGNRTIIPTLSYLVSQTNNSYYNIIYVNSGLCPGDNETLVNPENLKYLTLNIWCEMEMKYKYLTEIQYGKSKDSFE